MKKYIFLILFIYICSFPSSIFGQSKIDSLIAIVETPENSIKKLDASIELAHELLKAGNGNTKKYLDEAENLLVQFPDSIKTIELKRNFANFYIYKSEYKKAAEYFLSAIKLAENANKIELKNSILNGLALLNLRTKNFKKGIGILKELLAYSKQTNNDNDIIYYSLNIAMANGEAGNLDEAEKYLIDVFNSNPKNKFYKAVAANNLSFIYNNKKEYKKALTFGKYASEYSKNIPDDDFKIESMTNYSNALKGVGKNKLAGKLMFEILYLARKNNYVRKMNNSIGNIALNFEAMGDYKSAYKYYKEFAERKDSLLNEATTRQVNELQIKYETEKKDKEIEEKNESIKHKNLILTLSVSGVILFILISIFIFILYRMKNMAYKELVRKNLEIIKHEDSLIKQRRKQKKADKDKYLSSALSKDKKADLNEKLSEIMSEEKLYLQQDISLGKLAQKLEVNSKYLSQVIHEFSNSSFSDFINQQRIKEAARLLSDKSYRHISIEGISEMVGFHTKSSFNTYFKKFIGVTPSFFSQASQSISAIN